MDNSPLAKDLGKADTTRSEAEVAFARETVRVCVQTTLAWRMMATMLSLVSPKWRVTDDPSRSYVPSATGHDTMHTQCASIRAKGERSLP